MDFSFKKSLPRIFLLSILYLVIFLLLHYAFEWFKWSWLSIFSGVRETTFEHMKIGFYSFLILSGLEYIFIRRKLPTRANFIFARLFSAVFLPWGMFLLFYIAPAVYGEFPTTFLDILYAILITLLLIFIVLSFSSEWENMTFSKFSRFWILFLFANSVLLFTVFTYRLPWAPFF